MAIFSGGFGLRFVLRAASRRITQDRVERAEPGAERGFRQVRPGDTLRCRQSMPRPRFVAGRPPDRVEPILELAAEAEGPGFPRIAFARLDGNHAAVIRFPSREVAPGLS